MEIHGYTVIGPTLTRRAVLASASFAIGAVMALTLAERGSDVLVGVPLIICLAAVAGATMLWSP